jgi:hypothetical protein
MGTQLRLIAVVLFMPSGESVSHSFNFGFEHRKSRDSV